MKLNLENFWTAAHLSLQQCNRLRLWNQWVHNSILAEKNNIIWKKNESLVSIFGFIYFHSHFSCVIEAQGFVQTMKELAEYKQDSQNLF